MYSATSRIDKLSDAEARRMLADVVNAQRRVKSAMSNATRSARLGTSAAFRESVYADIRAEYAKLEKALTKRLKAHFTSTARSAYGELVRDASDFGGHFKPFDPVHMEDIFFAINPQDSGKLAAVMTDSMSMNAIRQLRSAVVETFRLSAVEGYSHNTLQKKMQEAWDAKTKNESAFRFVDKAGKAWSNASYLQMNVRTNSWNAWRTSYADAAATNGIDIMQISEDGNADCDICKQWEGKLISMTGATDKLPTYADALDAGVFHPNCVHRLIAVDPEWEAAKKKVRSRA